jgi:lysozyme
MRNHLVKFVGILVLIFGLGHSSLAKTVCPEGSTLSGVDVSAWQTGIDWTQSVSSNLKFAFIKASEGTDYTNPDFETDWPNAKKAGLTRGAYHYFDPTADGEAQADYYLSIVKTFESGDLPPMLDLEEQDGVDTGTLVSRVKVWLERVEKVAGKTPIIYVDPSFWTQLGNPAGFEQYPLFIADYDVECPDVPAPWTTWIFWQKTQTGDAAGVGSDVDMDVFNGASFIGKF